MGWFNRKKEKKEGDSYSKLPELPNPPNFLKMEGSKEKINLPTLPKSSFDQNTQKYSISTSKEILENEPETKQEETQIIQPPIKKPLRREISEESNKKVIEEKEKPKQPEKKTGPIFIRLDKFKDSLELFEEIKKRIEEINKHLENTKKLKFSGSNYLRKIVRTYLQKYGIIRHA